MVARTAAPSQALYDKYGPHSATAACENIRISNNATWQSAYQFVRPDDLNWTLVGQTFELDVQRNSYDAVPLLSCSTGNGRIITADPVQRVIYFNVPPADIQASLKPGTYIYDLVMVDTLDVRVLLMYGTLQVAQGVTYPPVG